jgi:hypothetical protein
MSLTLHVIEGEYAIARLAADAPFPAWLPAQGFCSVTRSADELSVVCLQQAVPADVRSEGGWRMFSLVGPFPFDMTGILLAVLAPLAAAEIGIFALSTFDTDHVLVQAAQLEAAIAALRADGHVIHVHA